MANAQAEIAICWFRRDLRLDDNPALSAALEGSKQVICLYILEEGSDGARAPGGARKWWLDKSLKSLSGDIEKLGGKLILRRGDPETVLSQVIEETGARAVYWNRRYAPSERKADEAVKTNLKSRGLVVESFNGSLLTEPWTFQTGSGGHYRVFTPYWRALQARYEAPRALQSPTAINSPACQSDELSDWRLHPRRPDWSGGFSPLWAPGESSALARLEAFIDTGLSRYEAHRNRPDVDTGTSGLSPHLSFGEISPAQIWRRVMPLITSGKVDKTSALTFLSEIAWREFSYVLLYHNENLSEVNHNRGFDHMDWRDDPEAFEAWCKGETGYPIVDAGMRQLWQTGWMHNRVRMIVASFLCKHLLIDWRAGEKWFWDTLVDADPASNPAGWQWVAGSGADASPYFRIFNPITQGSKFDETGKYVRRYCPEIAKLPAKYLYQPWEMKMDALKTVSIKLGESYPRPIVSHKAARERALAAYEQMKQKRDAS